MKIIISIFMKSIRFVNLKYILLPGLFLCMNCISPNVNAQSQASLNNTKIDGYRGIWFELNQKYEYGDKYSGALGTYTAKHVPLAIYAPEVDKTFFVFGGTPSEDQKYLLCMIGEFDHESGKVSKPTVVYDKKGVNDPHDNPSILIDDEGYIWVFVSGRGRKRPGFKFRSKDPFSIEKFELMSVSPTSLGSIGMCNPGSSGRNFCPPRPTWIGNSALVKGKFVQGRVTATLGFPGEGPIQFSC